MFNGSGPRNRITEEQMDSIYRQVEPCLKNELSSFDAANIANEESGMNINSAKNTIQNIKQMLQGKIYKYQCRYEHTKFEYPKN